MRASNKSAYPYPWRALDPQGPRVIATKVYLNEWERSVLHYVAGVRRESVSGFMLEEALRAALLAVIEGEG